MSKKRVTAIKALAVFNLIFTEAVALFEIVSTHGADSFWFYYILCMSTMAGWNVYLTLKRNTSGPMPYINYLILFLNVTLLLITAVGNDSPFAPILTIACGGVGFGVLIWLIWKFIIRKKRNV